MQKYFIPFLALLLSPAFAESNHEKLQKIERLQRLAFGSCNNQLHEQPLWDEVLKQKPDLWIWGGDNIYADWGKIGSVAKAYQLQNENPGYQRLKTQVPVIGTWDDHDFAFDNANGRSPLKIESQRLLLDFLEVPEDSPRRLQEGIYTSHTFGPENEKIKIIILDNRYFKDLEESAPLLGETQWRWLEEELKTSDAQLHFFVAGLSIFSTLMPYTDEWWQWPGEVNRLLRLVKEHQVKAPVFLTGDKHFSSIFKYSGQLEFMSSGLTHTAHRMTWWYASRRYPNAFFGLNYGLIEISWDQGVPILDLSIRNTQGRIIHPTKVRWEKDEWKFIR